MVLNITFTWNKQPITLFLLFVFLCLLLKYAYLGHAYTHIYIYIYIWGKDIFSYCLSSWWRTRTKGRAIPEPKKATNTTVSLNLFLIWKGRFWKENISINLYLRNHHLLHFIFPHELQIFKFNSSVYWKRYITLLQFGATKKVLPQLSSIYENKSTYSPAWSFNSYLTSTDL